MKYVIPKSLKDGRWLSETWILWVWNTRDGKLSTCHRGVHDDTMLDVARSQLYPLLYESLHPVNLKKKLDLEQGSNSFHVLVSCLSNCFIVFLSQPPISPVPHTHQYNVAPRNWTGEDDDMTGVELPCLCRNLNTFSHGQGWWSNDKEQIFENMVFIFWYTKSSHRNLNLLAPFFPLYKFFQVQGWQIQSNYTTMSNRTGLQENNCCIARKFRNTS